MAKFIRHDFGGIHDALNKLIIAEVKAALELLPGKCISVDAWKGESLCRIVVSGVDDYQPEDASVTKAWIDEGGMLHLYATSHGTTGYWIEDETDWLDITDFGYLIDQIAEQVESDKTVNLIILAAMMVAGKAPELDLKAAIDREI